MAATALIQSLAWELPYARGVALKKKKFFFEKFPVAQWIKDPVLPLQWLRSPLWRRLNPWPGNCAYLGHSPEKKKKIALLNLLIGSRTICSSTYPV